MDPVGTSVQELSPYGYVGALVVCVVLFIAGAILAFDMVLNRRRPLYAALIGVAAIAVPIGIGALVITTLNEERESHRNGQIDRMDNELSQQLGIPVEIFGEDILRLASTPSTFTHLANSQLRISYRYEGEVYWLTVDVKQIEANGDDYRFEVYRNGEPKLVEDYVADMEIPLLDSEGLVPAKPTDR